MNDAVQIDRPEKASSALKTPLAKPSSRVAAAKREATDHAADAYNPPTLPEMPVGPDRAATAPQSPPAANDATPAPDSPGEAFQQSFGRMVQTFGGLLGERRPPAVRSDPGPAQAGWAVQLAAPKSEAEAESDLRRLSARHASTLNGSKIGVHKAVVHGGTVYRLRVDDLSKADASALCARLKDEGGSCFVAR